MFFSFDGIDGAGKSTQMTQFVDWLSDAGHDVITCRDPGSTDMGEAVRAILLQAKYRIDFRAEMLLYMACRAQLVQEVIRPALESGQTVVSDRFILANVVYQGSAGTVDPDDIWHVGEIATEQLLPDMTFVLDIAPEIAAERVGDRQDRLESRGLEYFTRVREGFLKQAMRYPEQHMIVDATQTIEEMQTAIRQAALRYIQQYPSRLAKDSE